MAAFGAIAAVLGCGGGGQYSYAREYVPLGQEEEFLEQASPVSYEEVRRDPADFRESNLGWFGIVTRVQHEDGGNATVALTYRNHRERHLCGDERSSSCRVTVSERAIGPFSIQIQMRPEDREGQDRMWVGSLVKVYGSPTGDFDDEGGPLIRAAFYRHWPRGTYVTTGAAGSMRR
ncbi:MAG: hypothetical protein AAGF12_39575 [Myxococcota bacterium]